MEPVSLAIGLAPLAMNIVQVSSAIREQVSNFKSAPSDIQAIIEKTTLIGHMCELLDVEVILSGPQPHYRVSMLERALKMCCSSIYTVKEDIDKITKKGGVRRQSLNYLLGKSNVDKSMFNLNDSINMLNTCMTFSLLTSSRVRKDVATTIPSTESTIVRDSITPMLSSKQRQQPQNVKQRTMVRGNPIFRYESVYTSTQDDGKDCTQSHHRSYLFGLPLIGAYVSLAMRYGPFSPFELAIDTPMFIHESNDPILFVEIENRVGEDSFSEDWVRWAHEHKLRANTRLVPSQGSEATILSLTVSYNQSDMYKYLVQEQGLDLASQLKNFSTWVWRHRNGRDAEDHYHDPARVYAEMRGPFLALDEYWSLVHVGFAPSFHSAMFDTCKELFFGEDRNRFLKMAIHAAVGATQDLRSSNLEQVSLSRYEPFIHKLLAHGLDIHQTELVWRGTYLLKDSSGRPTCSRRERTTLGQILGAFYGFQPCDTIETAEEWLGILQRASIDPQQYLDKELEICLKHEESDREVPEQWPVFKPGQKLDFIYSIFHPYLRTSQNGDPTDDLFDFFPSFRTFRVSPALTYIDFEITSHQHWKPLTAEARTLHDNWPLIRITTSENAHLYLEDEMRETREKFTRVQEKFATFLRLRDERFERRQENKLQKLKRRLDLDLDSGYETMPGSWKMDWKEYQGAW